MRLGHLGLFSSGKRRMIAEVPERGIASHYGWIVTRSNPTFRFLSWRLAMPASKHKRHTRREILSRYATITDWRPSLTVLVRKVRGTLPERETLHSVGFSGTLEEPLNGVSELSGTIFAAPNVSLTNTVQPSIGSIISLRPAISLVVSFSFDEFSWLLTLVAGNQLAACYFACEAPLRGQALVHSLSFDKSLTPADQR